jgi:hypothetical protein
MKNPEQVHLLTSDNPAGCAENNFSELTFTALR